MSSALLRTVQEDFYGRLLAADYFADVAVILQRRALAEKEIERLLHAVKGRAGKVGACVIVQMPALGVVDPNLPGPRTQIVQSLLTLEHPTINTGSQGTQKSAEQLAVAALQLFHHFIPFGLTQAFVGAAGAIVPDGSFDSLVAYNVTLTTPVALARPRKVALPTITATAEDAPATIAIACDTAGAAIYYTVDGSYPSPQNEAATLYTAPFSVTAAATIRAAASRAGLQQSDVAQQCIS